MVERSGRLAVGLVVLLAAMATAQAEEKLPAKDVEFFEAKIRPVLVAHCYKCHSAEAEGGEPKAGLRLDTKAGVLAGGETGPALVAGDASGSLIMEALKHDGLEMPPGKKLPEQVIADFEQWIKLGAPDPRSGGPAIAKRTIDIEEGRKFWAFQPAKIVSPPAVKNAAWAKTDIDRFVLAGLEAKGLAPVADADCRTLIRRLYFDLIGLPPTIEEVEAFVADQSAKAVETVVDRLLASRHFGERFGRHWLDVARYAESNGNADNTPFPYAWRYRDYVIASVNTDKPFDRFIREQIAGDLLPADSPAERDELLIATGFLALGSKPRAQNNPNFQMDVVAEQLEVVTSGFMALTVACARCHDHKFDPIPTKEYYSLAGIFSSTQTLFGTGVRGNNQKSDVGGGLHSLAGSGDGAELRKAHADQLAAANSECDALMAELRGLNATLPPQMTNKNKPANAKQLVRLVEQIKPAKDASDEEAKQIRRLGKQMAAALEKVQALEAGPASSDLAMGAKEARQIADCAICIRGESADRGEVAPRGFVSVAVVGKAPEIPADQSGRLQLADWIASAENPLTSRVIVNRVWKHLFGRGIVTTVDNFGALGEKPSHPELLDQLALQFTAEGWSLKKLVRSLVLTHTYGLSSDHHAASYEKDPDNVYLWRHTPHRLDAEALRDAVLAVSGKLNPEPLLGTALPKGQDNRGRIDPKQLGGDGLLHRSIYLPIVRNGLPEVLDLFDVADPSLVIGSRDTTTVPAQSLYLMNSPFMIAQAKQVAGRLLAEDGQTDEQRLAQVFRLTLVRRPTAEEESRTLSLVSAARAAYGSENRKDPAAAELQVWATVAQALLASAEFRYVE
ncbi:MAG: PSD1 and planctomycete cytochrome C domain-containing protein [Pirellulaceae bacterium]|nr:PSD1 and planctomycete cytochrome C domain-containing protein [Pirellulaceae bacterium]